MPKRVSFTDQVRRAVEASDFTRYRIAQETGIPESSLSRFVRGEAGLSMRHLDELARLLELHVSVGRPGRPGGSKQ